MEQNNENYDTIVPGDVVIIRILTSIFFMPSLGEKYFHYRYLDKNGKPCGKTSFIDFYFGKT